MGSLGETSASGSAGDDRPGRVAGAEDRYVLLDPLGKGGTADVYAAFDRTLDRKIAIKLLRDVSHEGRLLREAQALARVRHPNVITVHDAGLLGDRVFLAMELVSGRSLRGWLDAERRSWREILAVFIDAGRGLGAVHEAGLVHRDFKPDNVLVGDDGTVRVADFGLVRLEGDDPPSGPDASPLALHLTATGSVVGTPRYMPPEQHAGAAADARSAQFSFCASLYQALFGQAPFSGESLEELRESVGAGRLRAPPPGKVPGWLSSALVRGLATRPEARWPSMDALLEHLGADRARGWRRAGVVAVVAAGATAFALVLARDPAPPACAGAEARLAGAWDAQRKAAVASSFLATGVPHARETAARVARRLDDYAAAWVAQHEEACTATAIRHEQSPELLDQRMACLDASRGELGALVAVFSSAPTPAVLDAAVAATGDLPDLAACADRATLAGRARPPTDPVARALFGGLRTRIDVAHALTDVKSVHAVSVAQPLVEEARALGFSWLEADAARVLAVGMTMSSDERAIPAYERAIEAARRARDPRLVVELLVGLVSELSIDKKRAPEAFAMAHATEAMLEALGGDPFNEALLLTVRSRAPGLTPEERVTLLEREMTILRAVSDELEQAVALTALGVAYRAAGRTEDSLRAAEESLALMKRNLGPAHPLVATALNNIATNLMDREDYAGARRLHAEALAIREASTGEDRDVATMLYNLAIDDCELGELDRAAAENTRALAIRERIFGAGHPNLASTVWRRARIAEQRGDAAAAIPDYRLALRMLTESSGPSSPKTLEVRLYLAAALAATGDHRAALAEVDGAQAGVDASNDTGVELQARLVRAELALARGEGPAALTLLAPALALGDAPPPKRWIRARALFAAARALRATGRDPEQAIALAARARAIWTQTRDASLARADAFLAARR